MTQTTSPDNIVKWTLADPVSLVQESQAQGDSIQAAFSKRERYDYVWDDAADRGAETGMVQGSRGYQIDTQTEYIYDNSNWRLSISYSEYANGGKSINNVTYTAFDNWSIDSALSTTNNMVTITGNKVTILDPGVYSLSLTSDGNNNLGNGSFIDFTYDLAHNQIIAIGGFTAGVCTVTVPFLRTTTANTDVWMWIYQNSGSTSTVSSTASNKTVALRIGRYG